jgi:hypothetical protein
MPEPLIGESITDIDSDEAGEIEVDLTGALYHARHGLTWGTGSAELELKITRRLGVTLELGFVGATEHGLHGEIAAGLSVAIWHDYRRDIHLQFEARSIVLDNEFIRAAEAPMPDAGAPPIAFGLRSAFRRRWLTARFGFGPSIAGTGGPVPLWADAALYAEWGGRVAGPRGISSFAGVEVVTDWASATPVVISPEVVIGVHTHEVPIRLGFGVPFFIANRDRGQPLVGGILRLMLELDRD